MPSKAQIEFVFSPTDIFVFSFFVHPIIELEFNLALFLFTRWLVFFFSATMAGTFLERKRFEMSMKEIASITWRFFFLSLDTVHDAIRDASKVNIPLGSVIDNLKILKIVKCRPPPFHTYWNQLHLLGHPPPPHVMAIDEKRWQISVGMDGCQK